MNDENKGGPKTDQGKAISRLNAVSHGLLSNEAVLPDEDPKKLEALSAAMQKELNPRGELESFLVDRITTDMWRLRRVMAVETSHAKLAKSSVLNDTLAALAYQGKGDQKLAADIAGLTSEKNEKIMRYSTTIERSMYRALHELQRLQAVRNGQEIAPPAVLDVTTESPEK